MAVGGRFDIEAVRRKAEEEKRKAKRKAVVSYCTSAALVIALLVGGKIGWDAWSSRREAARQAEEAAKAREERAKAEAARKRMEAEREAREAREKKRREELERAEAEKRAREEERARREEERRKRQEAEAAEKARRKANSDWIEANKERVDETISKLHERFDCSKRVETSFEYGHAVDVDVEGERWGDLETASGALARPTFFELVNASNAVPEYAQAIEKGLPEAAKDYPAADTLAALVAALEKERFTMTVTMRSSAPKWRQAILLSPDLATGLAIPEGCKPFGDGRETGGWTLPFAFGSQEPLFVLSRQEASGYNKEWRRIRSGVLREAMKLQDKEAFVEARLRDEMKTFLATVRKRMAQDPAATQEAAQKEKDSDSRRRGAESRGSRRSLGGRGSSFNDSNENEGMRPYGHGRRTLGR